MLIRLLPASPHPSVLFNINFEDLPDGMALPPAWTTHLSNLMHDELPIPRYHHALDKASFLPSIIEEVVFDVPALLVTCRFIDGSADEWKIELPGLGSKCLKTLESVVNDVCLSTLETERERQREKQREKEMEWERERERLRVLQHSSPSSSVKSSKHKKKRSLLMTIVNSLSSLNSIINLSLPSPTISAVSSASSTSSLHKAPSIPSLPTFKPVAPPQQDVCPRFLRRRARSSLVDAFRLYVLHELRQRVPQGGYYVWVLHSLLNEARQRRDELLAREREIEREREREREQERLRLMGPPPPYASTEPPSPSRSSSSAGSGSLILFGRRKPNTKHKRGPSIETEVFSATTSSEPPISDDEEEADTTAGRAHERLDIDETQETDEDTDTDTDGSSIQTPTSEHFTLPLPSSRLPTVTPEELPPLVPSHHALQSLPPSPVHDPTELHIQNLTHLILLHNSHSARTAHDENNRLDALEVRGRRRAWLNRALCANGLRPPSPSGGRRTALKRVGIGMGAGHGGLGFSIPIRRSGLGVWVFNAEEVELEEVVRVPAALGPGQLDVIILEEEDAQFIGGERFSGHDERNGVEPKRFKVPVPSRGAQLLPVNELEEEDDPLHQLSQTIPSKSPDSAEHSDEDDLKFSNLNLNQYDDLRELQMDLDIVTGVGFDMDSSDEEEDPGSHFDINISDRKTDIVEDHIPEGGIRVAFEIPRPKALHARSPHLLPGGLGQRRQRQRVVEGSCDHHPVHQYCHPDTLPERCHTPIPHILPPRTSGSAPEPPRSPSPDFETALAIEPISLPQPAHVRNPSSQTPAYIGGAPIRPTSRDPFEEPSRPPSRAMSRVSDPAIADRKLLPQEMCVNEMGELVSGMEGLGLREGDGEEFTLAMDLPSKLLTSRFGGMSFAAMSQTRSFKGRARGATRIRGPHGTGEETMSVVVEDVESEGGAQA